MSVGPRSLPSQLRPHSRSLLCGITLIHAVAVWGLAVATAHHRDEPRVMTVQLIPPKPIPQPVIEQTPVTPPPPQRKPPPPAPRVVQPPPEPLPPPPPEVKQPEPPPPVLVERSVEPPPVVQPPVEPPPEPPAVVQPPVQVAVAPPTQPITPDLPPAPVQANPAPTPEPAVVAPPAPEPITPPEFGATYLKNPRPAYPMMSRRIGEQGTVLLRVYVSSAGEPTEVQLKSSCGHARLDEAARKAVRHWKFVPAKRGSQPVDAWVIVPIRFTLEG